MSTSVTQIIHLPAWNTSNRFISFEALGESNVSHLISKVELYHISGSLVLPLNETNTDIDLPSNNTLSTRLYPEYASHYPVSLSYKISVVNEEDTYNDYSKQIIEGVFELDKNQAQLTSKELGTYKWYLDHGTLSSFYTDELFDGTKSEYEDSMVFDFKVVLDDYFKSVSENDVTVEELCLKYDNPIYRPDSYLMCLVNKKVNVTILGRSALK